MEDTCVGVSDERMRIESSANQRTGPPPQPFRHMCECGVVREVSLPEHKVASFGGSYEKKKENRCSTTEALLLLKLRYWGIITEKILTFHPNLGTQR